MRCGPWKRSLSSSGSSVDRSSPGRRWATTCAPGGDRRKSRPWELGSSPLRPCHPGWSTSTQPCGVSEKAPPFTLGDTWAWVGSTSPEPPGRLRAGPGGDQTTGQRFSCHFISTLTNCGSLRFQVFASRAATCFWSFCAPWCARARAKSFSWLTVIPCMEGTASRSGYRHWEHMELFYLPPYVPSTTQRSTSTRRSWPMLGARGGITMQPD